MRIPTAITDPPVEQRVSESASETGGSDAAAVPAASAWGSGTLVEPEPAEVDEKNGEPQGKRKHTLSKKWLDECTWHAMDSGAIFVSPVDVKKNLVLWGTTGAYDDMNMKISD